MNVIAMFKEGKGICYYVNIASPTVLDQGYLKYIDYDLDVKLYPDGVERTLDENEYERHIHTYGYPEELSRAIEKSMSEVKNMIERKDVPFRDEFIRDLYQRLISENPPILNNPKKK